MRSRIFKVIVLFFAFVLVLSGSYLYAESYKFEQFSNKEGFNQNSINAIVQDRYDFLWIGTPNGLIKYDGYEFRQYTIHSEEGSSISHNTIKCLYTDKQGVLWIGTYSGIDVYIPWLEEFVAVPLDSNLIINQIDIDHNGQIWVIGHKALFQCDLNINEEEISFSLSSNILLDHPEIPNLNDFYFIDSLNILFASQNGLIKIELNNSKDQVQGLIHNFPEFNNSIVTTIEKINNIYWIGTYTGLIKATLDGDRFYTNSNYFSPGTDTNPNTEMAVLSIFEDKSNNVWVGTLGDGLLRFFPGNDDFQHFAYNYKDSEGVSSSQINCIYQDNFEVMWFGTAQGGLNKLDLTQKPFINYEHNPYNHFSISGNLVNQIIEDREGRVWVATTKALSRSTSSIQESGVGNLLFEKLGRDMQFGENQTFSSIFEDSKGYIWISSNSNVITVYNPDTKRYKKVTYKYKGINIVVNRIYMINQISEDKIVIGGDRIIVIDDPWKVLNNEVYPVLDIEDQVVVYDEFIQTYLEDSRGNHWFGTKNGLHKYRYRDAELEFIQKLTDNSDDSIRLSDSDIFTLVEDYEGHLWAGTYSGGLNKISFNNEGEIVKIDYITQEDMLPDDAIYGIIVETDTIFWISTDMGICRLNPMKKEIVVFDVRDGLPNNNFRQLAYHKGRSGYLYFGGLNGLTIFNPDAVLLNKVKPNVVIAKLRVNNKTVGINDKVNGKILLSRSISETENITFGPDAKTISFELVVQHTSTPSKNSLEYMLEGFIDEWMEVKVGKTTVTYTALPPGNYTLRIRGANADGLRNEISTDLGIKIKAAWYLTWWSYILYGFLFIAIILSVFRYLMQIAKLKQRLHFEQVDKQRIDSLNQGKLRFFTNISHEFRTPLTLISGPLEQVIEKNRDPNQQKSLSIIQNNTKRLLNLVDQLINFRKVEQGHISLNLTKETLGSFLYPATEAFEDYAIQKNINFFYKIHSPNEDVEIDVEKVERIMFNLLSNSFKNTQLTGNISVEAAIVRPKGERLISIKVIDDGKGIPEDCKNLIFDRFYQVKDKEKNVSGAGIGLAFCKSLIDMMGGEISVESDPGIRTCFTVLIPAVAREDMQAVKKVKSGQSFIKDWMPAKAYSATQHKKLGASNVELQFSILVIEDETEVREFITNSLSDKYLLFTAENGMEGLEKMKLNEPDLVVCDVMMPQMDGFEFCEKIKSQVATCHIPVILLTALEDYDNKIKGLEYGADDYISKPFSPHHLELRIEKLIKNYQQLKSHFSKYSHIPDNNIEISLMDKKFLEKVIEVIDANIADANFGVEEMARETGFSQSKFYRKMKQCTGQIPNAYLRNYRLQRAAELFRCNTGYQVAEVMYQIGIESTSYFSTSFKKLHGLTPSEFIRQDNAIRKIE